MELFTAAAEAGSMGDETWVDTVTGLQVGIRCCVALNMQDKAQELQQIAFSAKPSPPKVAGSAVSHPGSVDSRAEIAGRRQIDKDLERSLSRNLVTRRGRSLLLPSGCGQAGEEVCEVIEAVGRVLGAHRRGGKLGYIQGMHEVASGLCLHLEEVPAYGALTPTLPLAATMAVL